jgi:outer membrane protein insertion porin family
MKWFLLLGLFLAAQPARWPVRSVAVEGNRNYSKEQILAVAGIKVGQPAGKQEFEAARDRLMATGLFETVGYRFAPSPDGKAYAASFQVTEVEPVYPVRFEDLNIPEAKLHALFAPKIPPTSAVLDRYTKTLEELVNEKVAAKLTAVGPDQFVIVFRPARPIPAVAQVTYEGNQAIPSQVLQDAIAGVAIGVPYSEERFRQLLDSSVRPVYEARGLIRVAFPKIATEPAKDVRGLAVKVTVEEGPAYELGEVKLEGTTAVKIESEFKSGEVANFDEIAQGVEQIKKKLRRQGYMKADARIDRNVNDKRKTVDLTIHIDEGPRFVFGKLNIQGLDIHGEAAIKSLWALKEGKPFNADYPDFFLNRVREDQIFENLGKTRSEIKVSEKERTVDVTLYFR